MKAENSDQIKADLAFYTRRFERPHDTTDIDDEPFESQLSIEQELDWELNELDQVSEQETFSLLDKSIMLPVVALILINCGMWASQNASTWVIIDSIAIGLCLIGVVAVSFHYARTDRLSRDDLDQLTKNHIIKH